MYPTIGVESEYFSCSHVIHFELAASGSDGDIAWFHIVAITAVVGGASGGARVKYPALWAASLNSMG